MFWPKAFVGVHFILRHGPHLASNLAHNPPVQKGTFHTLVRTTVNIVDNNAQSPTVGASSDQRCWSMATQI